MITYSKFSREGGEHRELIGRITFHDLTWIDLIYMGIVHDEAAIVNVGIIALDSTELYLDIGKLMTWIVGHHPVSRRGNKHLLSIQVKIPSISRVQSLDGCRLPGDSINAL